MNCYRHLVLALVVGGAGGEDCVGGEYKYTPRYPDGGPLPSRADRAPPPPEKPPRPAPDEDPPPPPSKDK